MSTADVRAGTDQGRPPVAHRTGWVIPKIISVDDHVVEPAYVWQEWLPAVTPSRWRSS